jgi:hypothetical protein
MRKGMGGKSVSRFKHTFTNVKECKNIILKTFPSGFAL